MPPAASASTAAQSRHGWTRSCWIDCGPPDSGSVCQWRPAPQDALGFRCPPPPSALTSPWWTFGARIPLLRDALLGALIDDASVHLVHALHVIPPAIPKL